MIESAGLDQSGKSAEVAYRTDFTDSTTSGIAPLAVDEAKSETMEENKKEEGEEAESSERQSLPLITEANAVEESEAEERQDADLSSGPATSNPSTNSLQVMEVQEANRMAPCSTGQLERKSGTQLSEPSVSPASVAVDGTAAPTTAPSWVMQKQNFHYHHHENSARGKPVAVVCSVGLIDSKFGFSASAVVEATCATSSSACRTDDWIAQKQNSKKAGSRGKYVSPRSDSTKAEEGYHSVTFPLTVTVAASWDDWITQKQTMTQDLNRTKNANPRSDSFAMEDDSQPTSTTSVAATLTTSTSANGWISWKQNPTRKQHSRNSNMADFVPSASPAEGNRQTQHAWNVVGKNQLPDGITPGAVAVPGLNTEEGDSGHHLPRNSIWSAVSSSQHQVEERSCTIRRLSTFTHQVCQAAATCRVSSLLDRTSSILGRWRSRLSVQWGGAIAVVLAGELAPGQDGLTAEPEEHCGRSGSTLVLDGMPVPYPEEIRQRQRGSCGASGRKTHPCHPSHQWSKQLCAILALLLIAMIIMVAAIISVWMRTKPLAIDSEAETEEHLLMKTLQRISFLESLSDTDSPQHRAYQWLMEDGNFPSPSSLLLHDDLPRLLQRYALVALYFSTGGPTSWSEQFRFLSCNHECEWQKEGKGVICNNNSNVVALSLDRNNLTGTLPGPELIAFPFLEELNLSNNELKGKIPNELTALRSLRRITLTWNNLSGTLMENIGNLQHLKYFNVDYNSLGSTVPTSIGRMKVLKTLYLQNNMFTGPIPSTIGNMSSLEDLYFSFNLLSSTLPSSWNSLNELKVFSIHGNKLNGTLPVSPTGNSNLRWFHAGDNHLTGTVPSTLGALAQLTVVLLENNYLHGTIPKSFSNSTQLEVLSLGSNSLTGTLPVEIFQVKTLRAIGIGRNKLTGTLPARIGNINEILAISAEGNLITGTIPSTYGNLPMLLGLSLHSNLLSGTIPPSFSNNTRSLGMMLENNMLSGTVPENLAKLNNFLWMSLARNDLTGSLDPLCGANASEVRIVTADCAPPEIEVSCDCCICCNDGLGSCELHVDVTAYAKGCVHDHSCAMFSNGEIFWGKLP